MNDCFSTPLRQPCFTNVRQLAARCEVDRQFDGPGPLLSVGLDRVLQRGFHRPVAHLCHSVVFDEASVLAELGLEGFEIGQNISAETQFAILPLEP
jgi:hypothetical protein